MKWSVPGKILCALVCSPDCPGFALIADLYVDENGDKWDVCKWCHEWEQGVILQSVVE